MTSSPPRPHLLPARRRPRALSRPSSATAVVLALLVAGTGFSHAAWGQTAGQRDANRRRQQEVQAQLDLARASDATVEAELGRLNQAVSAQSAKADEARRAELAALAGVRDASARLAAIDTRVTGLRQDLARRAVQAYTDPAGARGLAAVVKSGTLDEAARRQTLLDVVQTSTAGVVEGLRGTRQDQAAATRALEAAEKVAKERAATEASRAKTLQTSQAAQAATHAELTKRINSLLAESAELAGHEQELQNLIRQRSAAVAASGNVGSVAPGSLIGSGNPSAAGLIWPLHGPVSSEFGPRWGGFHPGIDIALPTGAPIAAAKAGTVVFSGPNDGYGNFVVIDHGGGLSTAYAHQSRIVAGEGEQVKQGQIIGFVGSTGFSTGPHLHFEVRVDGAPQNPRNYEAGSP